MIELQNISKSYGSNQVLNAINLTLQPGKVYGIVGENGAGKTTLFRCMVGLDSHNGKVLSNFDHLKHHTGFLQTDPFFFSKLTGQEYLQLMCNARNIKNVDFEAKNLFELPLKQYASTYSTGMKKKLALTGILLQQNDFFILDEPFNGVDIQSNLIITELILKLKEKGKTIVLSSHIFSTLSNVCDEIHLLQNGQFTKKVLQPEFANLEQEMINATVGKRIDALDLD